jgi:hypothetical protein
MILNMHLVPQQGQVGQAGALWEERSTGPNTHTSSNKISTIHDKKKKKKGTKTTGNESHSREEKTLTLIKQDSRRIVCSKDQMEPSAEQNPAPTCPPVPTITTTTTTTTTKTPKTSNPKTTTTPKTIAPKTTTSKPRKYDPNYLPVTDAEVQSLVACSATSKSLDIHYY